VRTPASGLYYKKYENHLMQISSAAPRLSFLTLLLMISFASVNAVLFTPALPQIAAFFSISNDTAQATITWFLIGYTIGQLVYGPIANRFGRKHALYVGIGLQIFSSLLCIVAGYLQLFHLLVVARFLLALGSGVGLKMAFTLVNESYPSTVASQKIAYLTLAFAITPALGVALGGLLTTHFGWISCFYAEAIYGVILLVMVSKLPETLKQADLNAFKLNHLIEGYSKQFKNSRLIGGGLLIGAATAVVYIFAAEAPFVAINLMGMSSAEYGIANLLPALGLIAGSLASARLVKTLSLYAMVKIGIGIAAIGGIVMLLANMANLSALCAIFAPMVLIYFGFSFLIATVSTLALSQIEDKAHGSAVMNFINMGLATLMVLSLGFLPIHALLLPVIFLLLNIFMVVIYRTMFSEA
jgi:DHA1 family bicyclomycin/chloramphenicol resistance-like MFS transporter